MQLKSNEMGQTEGDKQKQSKAKQSREWYWRQSMLQCAC